MTSTPPLSNICLRIVCLFVLSFLTWHLVLQISAHFLQRSCGQRRVHLRTVPVVSVCPLWGQFGLVGCGVCTPTQVTNEVHTPPYCIGHHKQYPGRAQGYLFWGLQSSWKASKTARRACGYRSIDKPKEHPRCCWKRANHLLRNNT